MRTGGGGQMKETDEDGVCRSLLRRSTRNEVKPEVVGIDSRLRDKRGIEALFFLRKNSPR